MKHLKHTILILALLLIAFGERQVSATPSPEACAETCAADSALRAAMDSAISRFASERALRDAAVGVCVVDIRTGEPVAGHNMDRKLIPASITKLVTSATSLKQLTGSYRFRTRVKYAGELIGGTLDGNLVVEGSGDPTLDSRYFPERETFVGTVVEAMKTLGITSISGKIVMEERIPLSQAVPQDWFDSDNAETYGAGAYSINYNDNLFSLIIDASGRRAVVVDTLPHISTLKITNRMAVARRGRYVPAASRKKYSDNLTLSGTLRRTDDPIELVTTMPHPAEGLLSDLEETLEAEGISVANGDVDVDESAAVDVLSYESPELKEILHSLLSRSDNMYAESVLHKLGERLSDSPTRDAGVKAEMKVLEQWGVPAGEADIYDGSGLSRTNRFSPLFLSTLLRAAARDWHCGEEFTSLLPRAGVDGTVKKLLAGTALSGKICLKSGSMRGVRCYAGYYPADNPRFAVTMMVNSYDGNADQLTAAIERLFVGLFGQCVGEEPETPAVPEELANLLAK